MATCKFKIGDKVKVGDRVNYKGHNGTVICIQASTSTPIPIGVEFDTWGGCHHYCNGLELVAGKPGTTYRCMWCKPSLLKQGETPEKPEPPKSYNGKVVCVSNGYSGRITIPGYTVGKIYEVKDGCITADNGRTDNDHFKTVEQMCSILGNTFIPIVE